MDEVDAENLPWLQDLIARTGWPRRSAVGDDGASVAWLLAQHADSDPAFQRHCLELLAAAAAQGEASHTHQAYLTDRVLIAEGTSQEYGTQITRCTGKWEPLPLRAPESVDERRAAVALGPLADYLAGSAAEGLPTPPVIRCPGCNNPVEMWLPEPGQEDTARCDGCGQTVRIRIGASRQDLL
jgi:hypothetical protein